MTYISPLFWPNVLTITLARRRWETNSNDFSTPNSNGVWINVSDYFLWGSSVTPPTLCSFPPPLPPIIVVWGGGRAMDG